MKPPRHRLEDQALLAVGWMAAIFYTVLLAVSWLVKWLTRRGTR